MIALGLSFLAGVIAGFIVAALLASRTIIHAILR